MWILFTALIVLHFLKLHCADLQGQTEQSDESVRVVVVVHIACGEGSKGLIVQAVWRSGSGFDDVSFVKFQLYFAGDILLSGFHECLNRFPERSEPFAFVHDLRELVAQVFLCLHGGAVQNELFQLTVSLHQNGSARCLIDAAGLHADYAVLYDIDDADAVLAAQLI